MQKFWKLFPYLLIFFLPLVFFWWALPFYSDLTIGSDYLNFGIEAQLELMYSLKHGSVPLFMPGLAHGNTSAALTLGQFYHPFTHIASHMPGYWAGYSLEWLTLLRLFSLAVAHLLVYLLFRRFGMNQTLALTLGIITIYNQRMLDMFRYGASLENYTSFIFLVVSLMWYALDRQKKSFAPLSIIVSAALLVVGGHAQIMYLGFLGAALLALLVPFLMPALAGNKPWRFVAIMRYWAVVFFSTCLGIILTSAYLFPFTFEFIAHNARRVDAGYYWCSGFPDTFYGIMSNFFNSFHSDSFAAFGGSSFILLALLAPLLPIISNRPCRRTLLLWCVLVALLFVTLGRLSPVHYFLWKVVPLYSSFRAPGRIGISTPFIIVLMLILLFKQNPLRFHFIKKSIYIHPLAVLSLVALFFFIAWNAVPEYGLVTWKKDGSGWSTPLKLNGGNINVSLRYAYLIFGAMVFISVFLWSFIQKPIARKICMIMLFLSVAIQSGIIMRFGGPVADKPPMATFQDIDESKAFLPDYSFVAGSELELPDVYKTLQHTFLEPRLAWVSPQCQSVGSQKEAFDILHNQERTLTTALVEESGKNVALCSNEKSSLPKDWQASLELTYSSYNRMQYTVQTSGGGLFITNYPYMNNWRAWVNNEPANIYRVNGLDMGVVLPEGGKQTVEFRYISPAATYGIVISCIVISLIICGFIISTNMGRHKKHMFCVFVIIACSCFCALYIRSFYSGTNLGVSYHWDSSQNTWPGSLNNIAYGKPTTCKQSALFQEIMFPASKAVDGYIGTNSIYYSGPGEDLWWQVDLGQTHLLQKIEILPPKGLMPFLKRNTQHTYLVNSDMEDFLNKPISVEISSDSNTYIHLGEISFSDNSPQVIPCGDTPVRYLRLKMNGQGALAFGDVRAYK